MIIERALGEPGFFGHGIDRHRAHALAVEQLGGGCDDALAGRVGSRFHKSMYTD
jgi:hypothetical protein